MFKLSSGKLKGFRSICLCSKQIYTSRGIQVTRSFSNGIAQGRSGLGLGKVVIGTGVAVSTVVAGVFYYANINPKFRRDIEKNLPNSSVVFDSVIGKVNKEQVKTESNISEAKTFNSETNGKNTKSEQDISSFDQTVNSSIDFDTSKTAENNVTEVMKNEATSLDEKSEASENDCKKYNQDELNNNEEIINADKVDIITESSEDFALKSAIAAILDIGEKVIQLHEKAVTSVQQHLDDLKDCSSKEDWELQNRFSVMKKQTVEEAKQVSKRLRDIVDSLQAQIYDAEEKGLVTSAQFACEALQKLTSALESGNEIAEQNEKFMQDIKENVVNEIALTKPDEMESQSNDMAKLLHAQKRISDLEDMLKAREQHEVTQLQESLKKQQIEQEKLSDIKLSEKLEELRNEMNSLMVNKVAEEAERHELDLRNQLRRQSVVFTDHLNEVIKVREAEITQKYENELREKLLLTKQETDLKLRGALAKLKGIMSAINENVELEQKINDAQKLWLASHSLFTVVVGLGDLRDRPYPVHAEVEYMRHVTNENEAVSVVLDSLSDDAIHRGIYTEELLRRRFPKVKQICRQVSLIGEKGGGVWSHVISYLQSLFLLDTHIISLPTSIDPDELDNYHVLSLASCAMQNGDTEQAVRFMNQLRGEPRRVAKDWIREARLFLEAKQAARFLTALSLSYNIGAEQSFCN